LKKFIELWETEVLINALPAVELLKKFIEPPPPPPPPAVASMDALAAVERLKKFIESPTNMSITAFPALALFVKRICAPPKFTSPTTKVWPCPELLVIPVPLRVRVRPGLSVMV
jgi:hypothetical protein